MGWQRYERSPQTVVFTDVVASTDLRVKRGDLAADEVLDQFRSLTKDAVERYGGREVKWTGDGSLAMFNSPTDAVRALVELQREASKLSGFPSFRVGINCGEVEVRAGDLAGQAVHAAARVVDRARGGEILVTGVVRDLVGSVPGIRFRPCGEVVLRGFSDATQVFEVEWGSGPRTLNRESPLAGRERELAALRGAMSRARSGSGGTIAISGEAGIGKSRLLEEMRRQLREERDLVIVGACSDDERAASFEPVAEALDRLAEAAARSDLLHRTLRPVMSDVERVAPAVGRYFPDLPPSPELPAGQESRYLFERVADVFLAAAQVQPLVLMIEDVHWADVETLRLLQFVALKTRDSRILLVLTHRDSDYAAGSAFEAFIGTLVRGRCIERLPLRPLERSDVSQMLTGLFGTEPPDPVVTSVAVDTDGNPFFIEEVARFLFEESRLVDSDGEWQRDVQLSELEVPSSVRLIIQRRLERLRERTARVLQAAAVVGREFELRLLASLVGEPEDRVLDVLDEAAEGRVIDPLEGEEDCFRFNHELTRQTLLAAVSAPKRRRLHLAAAQALDERGASAIAVAYHYERAGAIAPPAAARSALVRAGKASVEAASFVEGERLLDRALGLFDDDLSRERVDCLFELAKARRGQARIEEALELWQQAAAGAEELGDGSMAGAIYLHLAREFAWALRWLEAFDAANRGIAAMGEEVTLDLLRLMAYRAVLLSFAGDPAGAELEIRRGEKLAEALDDELVRASRKGIWALHFYNYLRFEECVEAGSAAIDPLRRQGELWGLADIMCFVQDALGHLGRLDESDALGADILALAERLGHTSAATFARRIAAGNGFVRDGDIAVLESFLVADLAHVEGRAARQSDTPTPGVVYTWFSVVRFLQGRLEEARALAEKGVELEMIGVLGGTAKGWLALLLSHLGERDRALSIIDENWSSLPEPGTPAGIGSWQMAGFFVEVLLVLGERQRAASLRPTIEEMLKLGCVYRDYDARLTRTIAGIAAACAGDVAAARRHFELAEDEIARLGHPVERMELVRLSALALPHAAKAASLLHARDWYERARMPHHVALIDRLLGSEPAGGTQPAAAVPELTMRPEGEYWTVSLGPHLVRVRETKGLLYLHELVRSPGRQWHVLDLVAAVEGTPREVVVDEAGIDVLDDQAKAAYRRRIAELEAEIAEAGDHQDPVRADRAQLELDRLLEELSKAVGLGGRSRMTGSTAERARVNVTKVIRGGIKRIAAQNRPIGDHLTRSVSTGTTCSYAP